MQESWDMQVRDPGRGLVEAAAALHQGVVASCSRQRAVLRWVTRQPPSLLPRSHTPCDCIPHTLLLQAIYPISTTSEGSYRDPAIVDIINAHNSGRA